MIQEESTAIKVFGPLSLPYKCLLNFPIKVLSLLEKETDELPG